MSKVPGTFKSRPEEPVEVPFAEREIEEYQRRISDRYGMAALTRFKVPKRYRLGECNVLVSQDGIHQLWHLTISHPSRYPTWDEVKTARYRLCPSSITMAMFLPPPDEYVNEHDNTFGLWEVTDPRGSSL